MSGCAAVLDHTAAKARDLGLARPSQGFCQNIAHSPRIHFADSNSFTFPAVRSQGRFEVTITKPVQAKYIGEWKAGQPLGTGTFTFESGAQFTGQWDERKQKSKIKNEVLNMICEVPDEPEDPKATVSKFADSADERRWNDQCLYVECLQRDQATLIQQLATMQEDKDEALRQREQNMELQRALKASQLELELALDKNGQVTTTLSTLQEQLQRQVSLPRAVLPACLPACLLNPPFQLLYRLRASDAVVGG